MNTLLGDICWNLQAEADETDEHDQEKIRIRIEIWSFMSDIYAQK